MLNGYIKGDKYLFFKKVGATNVLLKLSYLQSRVTVDTLQKDDIYDTKPSQTFYRKTK